MWKKIALYLGVIAVASVAALGSPAGVRADGCQVCHYQGVCGDGIHNVCWYLPWGGCFDNFEPRCELFTMNTETMDAGGMPSYVLPVNPDALPRGEHLRRSCDGAVVAYAFSSTDLQRFSSRTATLDI